MSVLVPVRLFPWQWPRNVLGRRLPRTDSHSQQHGAPGSEKQGGKSQPIANVAEKNGPGEDASLNASGEETGDLATNGHGFVTNGEGIERRIQKPVTAAAQQAGQCQDGAAM